MQEIRQDYMENPAVCYGSTHEESSLNAQLNQRLVPYSQTLYMLIQLSPQKGPGINLWTFEIYSLILCKVACPSNFAQHRSRPPPLPHPIQTAFVFQIFVGLRNPVPSAVMAKRSKKTTKRWLSMAELSSLLFVYLRLKSR